MTHVNKPGRLARRIRSTSRLGVTLLEISLAVAILSIGLLGAAMTTVRTSELQRATAEYVQAHNTARDVLEQVRNGDLVQRFLELSAAPNFEVGDQQVEVRFPESLLVATLGGPPPATARFRDLDGDGQVDLNVGSTDPASLLPVQVTVRREAMRFQATSLLSER